LVGNCVTTNSSACTTGAESILMAFEQIKNGKNKTNIGGSDSQRG
jgi:3-oxoacyl-(acyl-carrier-protein) synthase